MVVSSIIEDFRIGCVKMGNGVICMTLAGQRLPNDTVFCFMNAFYYGNVQRIGGSKRANKVFELFLKTTYAKLRRARTYGLGNTLFPGHYAVKKADFITVY